MLVHSPVEGRAGKPQVFRGMGDVSAMLNGYKLFETQKPDQPGFMKQSPGVSIDAIGRDRKKDS